MPSPSLNQKQFGTNPNARDSWIHACYFWNWGSLEIGRFTFFFVSIQLPKANCRFFASLWSSCKSCKTEPTPSGSFCLNLRQKQLKTITTKTHASHHGWKRTTRLLTVTVSCASVFLRLEVKVCVVLQPMGGESCRDIWSPFLLIYCKSICNFWPQNETHTRIRVQHKSREIPASCRFEFSADHCNYKSDSPFIHWNWAHANKALTLLGSLNGA